MNEKCYLNDLTATIMGDIPDGIKPVVELFNTWSAFFFREFSIGAAFRYSGIKGDFLMSDTRGVADILIDICNGDSEPPICLLELLPNIKNSDRFQELKEARILYFSHQAKEYFFDPEGKYPENLEGSFKRICKALDYYSSHSAAQNIPLNIGIY